MAIGIVAQAAAGATGQNDTTTTSGIDTTGATLLVAFLSSITGATEPAPTDSFSNSWIRIGVAVTGTNNMRLGIWVAPNPTVGAAHTFTFALNNGVPTISVVALSGVKYAVGDIASPLGIGNSNSATSLSAGAVTYPAVSAITMIALNTAAAKTEAIDNGYTIINDVDFVTSEHFGLAVAYKLTSATATETPTWSWTTAISACAVRFTFAEFIAGANVNRAALPSGLSALG